MEQHPPFCGTSRLFPKDAIVCNNPHILLPKEKHHSRCLGVFLGQKGNSGLHAAPVFDCCQASLLGLFCVLAVRYRWTTQTGWVELNRCSRRDAITHRWPTWGSPLCYPSNLPYIPESGIQCFSAAIWTRSESETKRPGHPLPVYLSQENAKHIF